jgi:hypothetical protein
MSAAATRELVELAAKGAKMPGEFAFMGSGLGWRFVLSSGPSWMPLDDDGQSRRLAVRLNFAVRHAGHECEVFSEDGECLASVPIFAASAVASADQATDPCAAARLAVVIAAGVVAKAMP